MSSEGFKANLTSSASIKSTCDDYVLKWIKTKNVKISRKMENFKIFMLSCCVAMTLYAHYNKTPFPKNSYILVSAFVTYWAINLLINLCEYYYGKDNIVSARTTKATGNVSEGIKIKIDTKIEEFSIFYQICIRAFSRNERKKWLKTIRATEIYTAKGCLVEPLFEDILNDLFSRIDFGKKNK
ncbi:hypothetical protein MHBO_000161 [Bonamia ostreae]|uniref:Signal peptidase complex subunit 2 n=1 Tax=Bonamia ostreae TaxID=126728 RepID=A0ABV2AEP4_9EUKA